MIKWLNYHHLLYFKIIATEGSIAKASKLLLVGQSSLSSQLGQLEDSLGQKLFERKNKMLILTDAGRIALEYADNIFKKGEEFVQVFNQKNISSKTAYRIGVVASAPKVVTYNLLDKVQKLGNNSFVSLLEDTTEELFKKLSTHEIDIAVTNNLNFLDKKDFNIKSIGSSTIAVFGSVKYKTLKKNFPKSLNGAPLVLPTKHSKLRYDLEHLFKAENIQYELIAEVQDSSVKKMLGSKGVGLIFLPEFVENSFLTNEKLIKIGSMKGVSEEYWLVSKKLTIKSAITEKLMNEFLI